MIIDTPPIAAVSDSFTLSSLVDKALYVIRWEQTPRNVALAGIRQLAEAGADIAGIVLSRVDLKKHARYGYADSGYYRGSYQKYYINWPLGPGAAGSCGTPRGPRQTAQPAVATVRPLVRTRGR